MEERPPARIRRDRPTELCSCRFVRRQAARNRKKGRPRTALIFGLAVWLCDRRPGAGRFDLGCVRRCRGRRRDERPSAGSGTFAVMSPPTWSRTR